MKPIDFHTHHSRLDDAIIALVDGTDTWGIHPWHADQEVLAPDLSPYLAIGECGLDALHGPTLSIQENTFRQQITLSERYQKPLIIHCVKALDTLLRIHRESHPSQCWILHGFRGKPQQAQSLLRQGFYLSFGWNHNVESLRQCPLDQLLLETDEDPRPIEQLYLFVATELRISTEVLTEQMHKNYVLITCT